MELLRMKSFEAVPLSPVMWVFPYSFIERLDVCGLPIIGRYINQTGRGRL